MKLKLEIDGAYRNNIKPMLQFSEMLGDVQSLKWVFNFNRDGSSKTYLELDNIEVSATNIPDENGKLWNLEYDRYNRVMNLTDAARIDRSNEYINAEIYAHVDERLTLRLTPGSVS